MNAAQYIIKKLGNLYTATTPVNYPASSETGNVAARIGRLQDRTLLVPDRVWTFGFNAAHVTTAITTNTNTQITSTNNLNFLGYNWEGTGGGMVYSSGNARTGGPTTIYLQSSATGGLYTSMYGCPPLATASKRKVNIASSYPFVGGFTKYVIETNVVTSHAASGNTFYVIGFSDDDAANQIAAGRRTVALHLDSGNWKLYTANGTTGTDTDTGVAGGVNAFFNIKLEWSRDSVTATINGTATTATATLPQSGAVLFPQMMTYTADATNRILYVESFFDYFR